MKSLASCTILFVVLVLTQISNAHAAQQFSAEDTETILKMLGATDRSLPEAHGCIDQVSKPMNDEQALVFCIHYLYSDGSSPLVKYEENGNASIRIQDLKNTAREVLGYALPLAENFNGKLANYTVVNGVLQFPVADGVGPDFTIKNIVEDAYGLVRVSFSYKFSEEEDAKPKNGVMILRDNKIPGKRSWHIVYFKES